MKKNNMLLAFVLNVSFTIIEIIGGILTNSISIISDAIHDFSDSISIGISIVLEKVSKKKPNKKYTYGYLRYSILGALINLCVLTIGTTIVIYNAIPRLLNTEVVNYKGMILLAILGVIVNGIGAFKTIKSSNLSEKVISLHLLEDVLTWAAVLVVSIVMNFTNLYILDPILSLCISGIILLNVFKNFKKVFDIFLEKVPLDIDIDKIKDEIVDNDKIIDLHHIHIWTMNGSNNYMTAHLKVNKSLNNDEILVIKKDVKHKLSHMNIGHVTLEIEVNEECDDNECNVEFDEDLLHHHH